MVLTVADLQSEGPCSIAGYTEGRPYISLAT